MKKLFLVFLLSAYALFNYAQSSRDNDDLVRIANAFFDDWNKHDFSNMPGYATEDFCFVIGPGILWKGRELVQTNHQNAHKTLMKNTSFIPDPQSISKRYITADVAIINMMAKMGAFYPPDGVDRGNNKAGDNQIMLTIVEVRKNGKWLLTAAQGTAIDPRAAGQ
ncbi:MAG TPA: SgcJ/EcaC family oxidoreductase [Acidobacteriota bacterium]